MFHVVYCFDHNYRQHFGASVTSLLLNYRGPGDGLCIHMVTDSTDAQLESRLETLRRAFKARFELHVVDAAQVAEIATLPLNAQVAKHITTSTYFRLLVPQLLPAEVERILYLDSDTIIIGDIRKLLTFDLGGHCIAGVQDTDEDRFQKFENYHQYINAGVLLMDLKKWRAMDYTRKCFDFGRQPSRNIIYADQCIINSVLADDLTKLPPRWNRFIRGATKIVTATPPVSASEDARIVHYVGAEKPWQAWCTSPDPEYYWTYVTASPWKGAAPVAPVTVNQHHSMARKQMAAGDFEQAGESYERVVTHLLAKSVTRNSQAAWHANRDPQP